MQVINCPLCGVVHTSPVPVIKTTYWQDSCGCNDIHRCPQHQLFPEEAPDRPSDILERAIRQSESKNDRWLKMVERFEKAKMLLEQLGMQNY